MKKRVMWLLNHTAARKFEVPMLKKIGFHEIFLPKSYPQEVSFRSASIDYSEDQYLSIPARDLQILNAADWYNGPDKDTWAIANEYFDILFFIVHFPIFANISQNFKGVAIWRAYGLDKDSSYTGIKTLRSNGKKTVETMGKRFWFGIAYQHLHQNECEFLKNRSIFLPLGLHNSAITGSQWNGEEKKILFVCPGINFNPYYSNIYNEFKASFHDMPYAVSGAQPVSVNDPDVLGFVSDEIYGQIMREFRVMFYHSTEPNHIHYHPFEAIRAGMPLVFMAGGILDRFGGINQPGRCQNIEEARSKIRRILDDDWELINTIRENQPRLLDPMKPENCEQAWRDGFDRIIAEFEQTQCEKSANPTKNKCKIAVIVPIGYRGGTLRGAKVMAHALWEGSRQSGEDADIVLAHLDDPELYPDEEFEDLHPEISRRAYHWDTLNNDAARLAMRYAGHDFWEPNFSKYVVPDDGIQQFLDCDLWIIVSDRMDSPLLPIRPYISVVFDYLQRYEKIFSHNKDYWFLNFARLAERVLVTTKFTEQDALQYSGVVPEKIKKVPMLTPSFKPVVSPPNLAGSDKYFIWSTNTAPHKNHKNAILALKEYYETLEGKLECRVTGVGTAKLLENLPPQLDPLVATIKDSRLLRSKIRWLGELPDSTYQMQLSNAAFLWHPGRIDNGTFSVVEAAQMGVPSLSSDYPAMREIDAQFQLNLTWMDSSKPKHMANQLKWIEENLITVKKSLPGKDILEQQEVGKLASEYWKVVRECL